LVVQAAKVVAPALMARQGLGAVRLRVDKVAVTEVRAAFLPAFLVERAAQAQTEEMVV
jgi:hypothetical protein